MKLRTLNEIGTALIAMLLILSGCGCGEKFSVSSDWVAAERATHDTLAPEYLGYVDADDNLTADDKARRHRTVELWDARIEAHEGVVQP